MAEANAAPATPSVHTGAIRTVAGASLPKGVALKTVSAAKVERIVARAVGIFGIVFGLQSVPLMLGQLSDLDPVWSTAVNIGLFGGLIFVALATFFNRCVRLTTSWVAFAYVLALLVWPLTVTDAVLFTDQKPWLWFLCTVATSCAAIAFSVAWATLYTIIVPVIYGALRTVPSGGGVEFALAALDTVYAIILGLVVLIIITMLRQAAAAVDVAQMAALSKYSTAVRQHATEVERIEVDAIVHDSVLTTFISAANAQTKTDEELAASMARDAISRLDAAGAVLPGDDRVVQVAHLERRIRAAVVAYASPVSVKSSGVNAMKLPVQVTEALYSATVQALVNSLQHADGDGSMGVGERPVRRSLSILGWGHDRLTIEVTDTGVGFDASRSTAARIGLRVSILERMAAVGGLAQVESTLGRGTTIRIEWPSDERPQEIPTLNETGEARQPSLDGAGIAANVLQSAERQESAE